MKSARQAGTGPGRLWPPGTRCARALPSPSQWPLGPAGSGRFFWGAPGKGAVGDEIAPPGAVFPPRRGASGPCHARPCEGRQVRGQRCCAGEGSRAGLARGLGARASSGELRVGRRRKVSDLGLGVPGMRDARPSSLNCGQRFGKLSGSLRLWVSGRREQRLVSNRPAPGQDSSRGKGTPCAWAKKTGVDCPCCPAEPWN